MLSKVTDHKVNSNMQVCGSMSLSQSLVCRLNISCAIFPLLSLLFSIYTAQHTDPNPTTTIQRDSNTSQLFAGYDLVLSCSISINLNLTDRVIPAASWFKDGIEYSFNWDSHISVSPITLSADGVYITTLSFMPLNLGDSGHYQCVSTLTGFTGTTLANATDSTTLTVEGTINNYSSCDLHQVMHDALDILSRFATNTNSAAALWRAELL